MQQSVTSLIHQHNSLISILLFYFFFSHTATFCIWYFIHYCGETVIKYKGVHRSTVLPDMMKNDLGVNPLNRKKCYYSPFECESMFYNEPLIINIKTCQKRQKKSVVIKLCWGERNRTLPKKQFRLISTRFKGQMEIIFQTFWQYIPYRTGQQGLLTTVFSHDWLISLDCVKICK